MFPPVPSGGYVLGNGIFGCRFSFDPLPEFRRSYRRYSSHVQAPERKGSGRRQGYVSRRMPYTAGDGSFRTYSKENSGIFAVPVGGVTAENASFPDDSPAGGVGFGRICLLLLYVCYTASRMTTSVFPYHRLSFAERGGHPGAKNIFGGFLPCVGLTFVYVHETIL